MPKLMDFVSEVAPPADAETESWYRFGVPNWYGHHSAGLVTCNWGYATGSKAISRRSLALSVTVWLTVTEVVPVRLIVPLTVAVTGALVALSASTYRVRLAELVAGNGSTVWTYGSRSATGPVVSSSVLPQMPAFMSGASGFQSTVQKDRSLQLCAGGVTRIASALTAPGLMPAVALYSWTAMVPTALASNSTPLSQT